MKRATTFMVEKVSTNGGYVWTYLPDLSRRWGEMEARDAMIWIQPPGTADDGASVPRRLSRDRRRVLLRGRREGRRRADLGAASVRRLELHRSTSPAIASLREWYDTIGQNGWRLEEFQHYWGNATFDDAGTAESAKFLLRLYVEKRDPKYKPALDKAIQFVLDSQYPIGAWPQRYPLQHEFAQHGKPDYTSYPTFNDDVAAENIDFLVMCYQALGDPRVLDPIMRGMNAFLVTQQGPPQPGWALQYTLDLKPSGARTYEPNALVTHTTAHEHRAAAEVLPADGRHEVPGAHPRSARLARQRDAAARRGAARAGRTHPTFIELGTNKPLYVHREGLERRQRPLLRRLRPEEHARALQRVPPVDVAGLRKRYQDGEGDERRRRRPADSPLRPGAGLMPLPRFFMAAGEPNAPASRARRRGAERRRATGRRRSATTAIRTRVPARRRSRRVTSATTHVGDETDTSPFPGPEADGHLDRRLHPQHERADRPWRADLREMGSTQIKAPMTADSAGFRPTDRRPTAPRKPRSWSGEARRPRAACWSRRQAVCSRRASPEHARAGSLTARCDAQIVTICVYLRNLRTISL